MVRITWVFNRAIPRGSFPDQVSRYNRFTVDAKNAQFPLDPPHNDSAALRRSVAHALLYGGGRYPDLATRQDWYQAVASSVRDRMI